MAVDIVPLLFAEDFRRLLSFFLAAERQARRNCTKAAKYVQDHIFTDAYYCAENGARARNDRARIAVGDSSTLMR
jgi:hypothetical protein